MKDHSQQLKAGKRYLFKNRSGDRVWSATVIEVAEAYIHVRYESVSKKWIARKDFTEDEFHHCRTEVLQELSLAVTPADEQLDAIRKLLSWPIPGEVSDAVALLHHKYMEQCDTLQRGIKDLGITGCGGDPVADVIVEQLAIHDLLRMARWLVVVYYWLGEVERIANDYLKR